MRLPYREALQFDDSFEMAHFRELQQQTNDSEAQKDEHRREAVVTAAADEGVGRQELQQFANQLHQQSQHVNEGLINNLNASAAHARRGLEEQAAAFARQMAQERLMADNRMRMVHINIDALANQPRVPEARAPPTQGNNDKMMHMDDTVAQILGEHGRQSSASGHAFGQHMSGLSGEMVRRNRPHPLANCPCTR